MILHDAAVHLEDMYAAGVRFNMDDVANDYIELSTREPSVASKYGFEEDEDYTDEEESWDVAWFHDNPDIEDEE